MKSNLPNYLHAIVSIVIIAVSASCKKWSDIPTVSGKPEKELIDITNEFPPKRIPIVHLYRDTVYNLSTIFTREEGEQIIIDPGTLIKVNISAPAGGTLDAGIVIQPGGIIQAAGTSSEPIVFTSNDYTGTQMRNWNGIQVIGKSTDNSSSSAFDLSDFSGTLSFIRVEFAPLTLTAVGSRTIVDHIQVSYVSARNSFEFVGGSFNAKYLMSYACGGPADFYITRGYQGNLQHLLAYRHPFFGKISDLPGNTLTGLCIENGPDSATATTATPFTRPVISNLSVIGPNGQAGSTAAYSDTNAMSAAMVTSRSASFAIRNSLFLGFPAAGWYLNDARTAESLRDSLSQFQHCFVQSAAPGRLFYLQPGILPGLNSEDFKNYMLAEKFGNREIADVADFRFAHLYAFEKPIDILPRSGSPVLIVAAFDGPLFSDSFFDRSEHLGAFGDDDWTVGWSNFVPLKTNYNFPQ